MRSLGALPKSVLILEAIGMVVLAAAWLSLNQYVTLPDPFASQLAAVVMIFVGIALMLPAAAVLFWGIARAVAPQLMNSNLPQDKEKKDDTDH
ncbi:YbjC family protein [Kluyvera cryocrescens]|uniref:YbjC family protein n=1 Tax=Kluyvera cryocrescens TaxID=580 RepID=UPI0030A3D1A8|nr:YbjC family protein [Kluyvera ascorbata]